MEKYKPSEKIISYIKLFEALRHKSYRCPAGVWTIGWGTTIYPNKVKVQAGDVCTKLQAKEYFTYDLDKFSNAINGLISVYINQNQLDALTSLVYNIGTGNFSKSTLLRVLNTGHYTTASEQFLVWCKARDVSTGKLKVLRGLQIRRKKEKEIFNIAPDYTDFITFLDKIKAKGISIVNRDKEYELETI